MSDTLRVTRKIATNPSTISSRSPLTARPRSLKHEDIALLAHSLYVQSGYQNGRDVEFWLEAERRLREDLDV